MHNMINILTAVLLATTLGLVDSNDKVKHVAYNIDTDIISANVPNSDPSATYVDVSICLDSVEGGSEEITKRLTYDATNVYKWTLQGNPKRNVEKIYITHITNDPFGRKSNAKCKITNNSRGVVTVLEFTDFASNAKGMMELTQKLITSSHEYLIWSMKMASTANQRPGIAKYLRELSDTYWDNGNVVMQKHFEKLGSNIPANTYKDYFKYSLKDPNSNYAMIFQDIKTTSSDLAIKMNKVSEEYKDADMQHFFGEMMEDEMKRLRKAAGRVTTLDGMKDHVFAVTHFDQSL